MDSTNKNEMEQIQRGLEAFLEKEMDSAPNPQENRSRSRSRNGSDPGYAREPGEIDIIGQSRDREQARKRWQPDSEEFSQAKEPADERPYGDRRNGSEGYVGRYDSREVDGPYIDGRGEEGGYYQDDWDADDGSYYPDGGRPDERDFYQDDWDGQTEDKPRARRRYQEEHNRRNRQYEEEEPYRRSRQYRGEEPRRGSRQYEEEEPYRRAPQYEEEEPYRGSRQYREEEPRRGSRQYEEEEPYHRNRYEEESYPRRQADEASARKRRDSYEEEETSGKKQSKSKRPPQKKGKSQEAEPPREEDSRMSKKPGKQEKASKKKPRRKKHRLLKFLIGAAVLFALLGFGLYQLVGFMYGKMTYKEIAQYTSLPMSEDGVVNILLIGNDSRQNGEDGRSDAMILLSISSRTKKIYMTSLLRDMYVDIPGHDGNRLNAAYSYGGAELLMETIQQNFGIPVNRYMLVNFGAFVNLVDEVGGIDLELSNDEVIWVNNYLVEYNILTDNPQGTFELDPTLSGMVHLNGPQALAYTRNRFLGTDFGRTERQRKVLTAVIGKLPSAALTNMGGLIDGLMPNLTTNLTKGECFRLGLMAGKLITYDIESDSIPQPGTYRDVTIRKMQVLEVDFAENIRYLKEKIYGE